MPAMRDQVGRGARRRPAHRLGRRCSTAQRAVPGRVLGRAPTSRSRASRASSRRCASACSTSCRPGRGPRAGRSPAKGLTGSGYDGHAFWDTETFVLPMLIYAHPHAARDALRWRHSTLDAAKRARGRSSGSRAPRFRGGRSAARSARATGRRAPPPSTSTPTSPTRRPLRGRDRGRTSSQQHVRARAAGRDRAAVALARPPRRRRRVPDRRRHRARRVQRDRRQQHLHQPRRAAEPARRRRRGRG